MLRGNSKFVEHRQNRLHHHRWTAEKIVTALGRRVPSQIMVKSDLVDKSYIPLPGIALLGSRQRRVPLEIIEFIMQSLKQVGVIEFAS